MSSAAACSSKAQRAYGDHILVEERWWYEMNYPQQIAFMQSFECALAGGSEKQLLYMDVRSLATGRLLATWSLGVLKPAEQPRDIPPPERSETNSEGSEANEDENRIGLTGEGRAVFIKSTIDECRKKSATINCSCYANAVADGISIKELKEVTAPANREVAMTALRPKLEAAAKRCLTN